jgi:uncharacterized protein (TIGR00369 family)
MKPLPEHGNCFVCGQQNQQGFGIQWFAGDDGAIEGQITLDEGQQGPPGHAHGGASAALLDDAMGSAVWYAGHMVMAVNININFRRPVPLHVPLRIIAWVEEVDGRKVHTRSQLRLPDEGVAVEGTGLYVEAGQVLRRFMGAQPEQLANFRNQRAGTE